MSHAGDTYDDQSKVLMLWRRPAQLGRLIDYLLSGWRGAADLDPRRIGAFGFWQGITPSSRLAARTCSKQRLPSASMRPGSTELTFIGG